MTGKTHTTIGIAVTSTAMVAGWIPFDIVTLVSAAVFSLIPDIDTENSTINNSLNLSKTAYFIMAIAVVYFQRSVPSLLIAAVLLIIAFSRHRGITHSLLGVGILVIITWSFPSNLRTGAIIGYVLHLLADYFTPHGIEILFPNKHNYKVPKMLRINKTVEKGLKVLLMLIIGYNGYKLALWLI